MKNPMQCRLKVCTGFVTPVLLGGGCSPTQAFWNWQLVEQVKRCPRDILRTVRIKPVLIPDLCIFIGIFSGLELSNSVVMSAANAGIFAAIHSVTSTITRQAVYNFAAYIKYGDAKHGSHIAPTTLYQSASAGESRLCSFCSCSTYMSASL